MKCYGEMVMNNSTVYQRKPHFEWILTLTKWLWKFSQNFYLVLLFNFDTSGRLNTNQQLISWVWEISQLKFWYIWLKLSWFLSCFLSCCIRPRPAHSQLAFSLSWAWAQNSVLKLSSALGHFEYCVAQSCRFPWWGERRRGNRSVTRQRM